MHNGKLWWMQRSDECREGSRGPNWGWSLISWQRVMDAKATPSCLPGGHPWVALAGDLTWLNVQNHYLIISPLPPPWRVPCPQQDWGGPGCISIWGHLAGTNGNDGGNKETNLLPKDCLFLGASETSFKAGYRIQMHLYSSAKQMDAFKSWLLDSLDYL